MGKTGLGIIFSVAVITTVVTVDLLFMVNLHSQSYLGLSSHKRWTD